MEYIAVYFSGMSCPIYVREDERKKIKNAKRFKDILEPGEKKKQKNRP